MKPNFALSLSFEGIRLLHRAAGGWRVVGEVALDAADMPGELAVLRRTATALEPGGLRTKLLLPAEQVKYLTIDSTGMDEHAARAAARIALDEATPYGVDDLAFDISAEGDSTHVAAVARETLAEAEAFAVEHRFHPTSFASIPGENPYLGEPFFGATKASVDLLAEGEVVEPDGIAVVVIGDVDSAEEVEESDLGAAPDEDVVEEVVEDVAAEAPVVDEDPSAEEGEVQDPAEPPLSTTDVAEDAKPERAEEAEQAAADGVEEAIEFEDSSEDAQEAAVDKTQAASDLTDAPLESDAKDSDLADETVGESVDDAKALEAAQDQESADAAPDQEAAEDALEKSVIPVLPSLGAASRAAPAASAVPPAPDVPPATGFSSRRGADPVPARKEPVVTAPSLPAEAVVATQPTTNGSVPPAPPAFSAPVREEAAPPQQAATTSTAPKTGFLSRRKGKAAPQGAGGGAAGAVPLRSEAERMTVFGARRDIGGKPRFLGLMLTAALLVFLAGVAAWASVFLEDGLSLSRLFGERAPRVTATAPVDPEEPSETPQVQTASLSPTLTEEDTAVLDALREPSAPVLRDLTPEQLEANYAITGIWPVAPIVPPDPAGLIPLENLYLTSIDPTSIANDAVALPMPDEFATDVALAKVPVPAAAGTVFALDDQGLVIPTVEGALSPDGFTVYAGRPDIVPPATPTRFQPVAVENAARAALAGFRPKVRPGDLAESNERANLDGLTRSELAGLRPQLRPKSVQQQAEAAAAAAAAATETATVDTSQAVADALAEGQTAEAFVTPTRLAIKASVRPDIRPRNFARIVTRAKRAPKPQAETRTASTGTVAPRVVTPKIPSKTSVAKQATQRNAINLRKVNLIGVYGKPSNRRALVRLANGRYKKVVVGDRIDGGRVSAIGDSELRYNKSGRNVVLKMPRG